ncbi:MAG TPA: hypothetical protein PK620_11585 [Denitromonas sp.]|uniref:hypothetical protein n=1 Tax=Denitromonas sp. TaxID=2734609 RepID=UPI001D44DBE3|nr:hypothetical protein [Rhodocyclaceae bacterium]MCP5222080.1 hypothetical protein [Zoogloeaceae bacterium]HPR06084.1 hypothetical protein [Denitromonas sp.]HQU89359.1 hypothetical protein [Denitromonas sp.]HQV15553.1 hypothetical protein [Denitromonas sp.]
MRLPELPLSRRARSGLCLALLTALVACQKTSPEQTIGEAIARIEQGIASHQNADVRAELADAFRGGPNTEPGQLDKTGVQRLLAAYFLRYKNIRVGVTGVSVEPLSHTPDQAWSTASVVLTGAEGLIPETGRIYQLRGLWVREGGDWQLRELQWE